MQRKVTSTMKKSKIITAAS